MIAAKSDLRFVNAPLIIDAPDIFGLTRTGIGAEHAHQDALAKYLPGLGLQHHPVSVAQAFRRAGVDRWREFVITRRPLMVRTADINQRDRQGFPSVPVKQVGLCEASIRSVSLSGHGIFARARLRTPVAKPYLRHLG